MDEEREPRSGIDRRTFIRRAAATGAAAAWATPVVQTIMARPAFAATASPATCDHSSSPYIDKNGNTVAAGGCMEACHNANPNPDLQGDPCGEICDSACPNDCAGTNRQCINGEFCDSRNFFHTTPENGCNVAEYNGSTTVSSDYPCDFTGTIILCAQQGGGCTTNHCV